MASLPIYNRTGQQVGKYDIDVALPDVALVEIEGHVDRLIAQLKAMR